jgi:hypothetical protein
MNTLRQNDLEIGRQTTPGEKLRQTLELMETGIRLKRAALRNARPEASETEIDQALERWLIADA